MFIRIFKKSPPDVKKRFSKKYIEVFEGELDMSIKSIYSYINIVCPPLYRGDNLSSGDIIALDDGYYKLLVEYSPFDVNLKKISFNENQVFLDENLIRFIIKEPCRAPYVTYGYVDENFGNDSTLNESWFENKKHFFSCVEYSSKDVYFPNKKINDYTINSDMYIYQTDNKGNKISMNDDTVSFYMEHYKEDFLCVN